MDYAVIDFQGHQYQVKPDQELIVDRLDEKENKEIKIDKVLLVKDGKKVAIGKPTISKAEVIAEVLEHYKGDKIRVAKFKAKNKYRRVKGFRPHFTKVKIKDIKLN